MSEARASRAHDEGPLLLEPLEQFESAFLGTGWRVGDVCPIAVYDYQLVVEAFAKDGMSEEEAQEWVDFNVAGAWMGPGTPLLLHCHRFDEMEEMD